MDLRATLGLVAFVETGLIRESNLVFKRAVFFLEDTALPNL